MNLKARKLLASFTLLLLFVALVYAVYSAVELWSHTWTWTLKQHGKVEYAIITDFPTTWYREDSYIANVSMINTDNRDWNVTTSLNITGPVSFKPADVTVQWRTYSSSGTLLSNFTVPFIGTGTLTWTSAPTTVNVGFQGYHLINATLIKTAPLGGYTASITITGNPLP